MPNTGGLFLKTERETKNERGHTDLSTNRTELNFSFTGHFVILTVIEADLLYVPKRFNPLFLVMTAQEENDLHY